MPYWLEHLGFDSGLTAIAFAVVAIGAAGGNLFGGFIGDWIEKRHPDNGRIMIAQISVFAGIPMMFIIFLLMPRQATTGALIGFILLGIVTGFLISWCGPAANNPILSELFRPEIRGTAFALDRLFEGSVAASGTAVVAAIATGFGFRDPPSGTTIAQLIVSDYDQVLTNINAMAWGIILATAVPWLICLLFYTGVYFTYPKDRDRTRKIVLEQINENNTSISENESKDELKADEVNAEATDEGG